MTKTESFSLMRSISFCAALLLFSACSTNEHLRQSKQLSNSALNSAQNSLDRLVADRGLFGVAPSILNTSELFELTEKQKVEFTSYVSNPQYSHLPKYQRLYNYIERSTYDFNYRGKTYTAKEAIDLNQGNCMSLALMTTALAKEFGVPAAYQLVDSTPVFDIGANAVSKGVHVRTKLFLDEAELTRAAQAESFSSPGIIVDYFPVKTKRFIGNIDEDNFIARYYRNLAVEFMQNGDLNNSYWYTLEAMDHAPQDSEGLNLMAVIFKQAGFADLAEAIYIHGISVADSKLSLLKNYRQLLREQQRYAGAAELSERIAAINDPSPYNWLSLADAMLAENDYDRALSYYKRAVDLAPYLQFGYLGQSKAYYRKGLYRDSEDMLQQAIERNYDSANDPLYAAKLSALAVRKTKR